MVKKKFDVSLLFFFAMLLLAPIVAGKFASTYTTLIQICAVCACIFFQDQLSFGSKTDAVCICVFIFCIILSAIFNTAPYALTETIILVSSLICTYLVSRALTQNDTHIKALVSTIALISSGICLFSIRNYATMLGGGTEFWQKLFSGGDQARMFATFENPNFFAGFLVISITLTCGIYLVSKEMLSKLVLSLALIFQTISIMLTGSRFGIISLAAAGIAFLISLTVSKSIKICAKKLVLPVMLIAVCTVVFSGSITNRVKQSSSESSLQAHSAGFRKYTWIATINMIRANPVLGCGAGTFEPSYLRYTIAHPTSHAHQSYLQICAECGIIAFFAFAIFSLSALGRGIKGIKNLSAERKIIAGAIFAALVGSGIRSLVDSDFYITATAITLATLLGAFDSKDKDDAVISTLKSKTILLLPLLLGLQIFTSSLIAETYTKNHHTAFDTASKISPLNPYYLRKLGKITCFCCRDEKKAYKYIDKAIKYEPYNKANYELKALVAKECNNIGVAISSFKKALALAPKSTFLIYSLAQIYEKNDKIDECDKAYEKLIQMEESIYEKMKGAPEVVDTTYAYAHFYFGKKYVNEKEYKKALNEFIAAKKRLMLWKKNPQIIEVLKIIGKLSDEEEAENLELLDKCNEYIAKIEYLK